MQSPHAADPERKRGEREIRGRDNTIFREKKKEDVPRTLLIGLIAYVVQIFIFCPDCGSLLTG